MHKVEARIVEIKLDLLGRTSAWIRCPGSAIPAPGQYCLADIPGDPEAVLPFNVMAGEASKEGFLALPMTQPLPPSWVPGISLNLRGPLGRGFDLPQSVGRLALVACEDTLARLYPLAIRAAGRGADISWFTDAPTPSLPPAHELNPLRLAPEALSWADWIALEVSRLRLPVLRQLFGLPPGRPLPCPTQVLVLTPLPCAGQADCGACAVPARRGWKLVCAEGPVFALNELDW
jgi:hypothetical protein